MTNKTYKSSPLTIVIRFVVPILLFIIAILSTILSLKHDSPESISCMSKILLVATIWIIVIFFQIPLRLRRIEVDEKGVLIKTLTKSISIRFEDIIWISKFHYTCPLFSTIKYYDTRTDTTKKIAYVPGQKRQKLLSDDAIANYVNAQKVLINPNKKAKGPSNILNFLLFALFNIAGICTMILLCMNEIKTI